MNLNSSINVCTLVDVRKEAEKTIPDFRLMEADMMKLLNRESK